MSIIGSLPYNLTNGTTADATQVMADFNAIVNGVNNASTGAASIPGVQAASYTYASDTGTVNALIVGVSPSPSSYTDGLSVTTKAANTNTSTTVTVQFGSLGTKSVVIDAAGTLPPIGSIISGMHYRLEYDSTQDKVILMNPSEAAGSATVTYTGMTATTTATLNYAIEPSGKLGSAWVTSNTTGTSNATTFTITGIPSAIVPATNTPNLVFPCTDNGASTYGSGGWGTSITLSKGAPVNGAWTSGGGKGIRPWSQTFSLN